MKEIVDEYSFNSIVSGHKNSYQSFLKLKREEKSTWKYQDFLKQLLEQDNLLKCDYYAIYDACIYLLQSFSLSVDEKKILVDNFVNKLLSAAEANHIAAQCALIILKVFGFTQHQSEQLLKSARRNALSLIANNKNNLPEKAYWANFFLGLYAKFIIKDPTHSLVVKYLAAAHNGGNAAASHFWVFNDSEKDMEVHLDTLKPYYYKTDLLLCMNLICAEKFLTSHISTTITSPRANELTRYFTEQLRKVTDYNPARVDYALATYYCYLKNKSLALSHFKKAYEGGIVQAQQQIKLLEEIVAKEQEKSLATQEATTFVPSSKQSETNRNFLIHHPQMDIVSLHVDLQIEEYSGEKDNIIKHRLESTLFEEVLAAIESNSKIREIRFQNAYYDLNIDKLLDKIKTNKNIQTLELNGCKLTIVQYIRILLFIVDNDHIENVLISNLQFSSERQDAEAYKLVFKALNKLFAKCNHLKKIKLYNLFNDKEDVQAALTHIAQNTSLSQTQFIIDPCPIDRNGLLQLAELLNKHITHFALSTDEVCHTANDIKSFAAKLTGNGTLQHFGFVRFIDGSCDDLIKASHTLFNKIVSDTKVSSLDLTNTIFEVTKLNNFFESFCSQLKKNKFIKNLNLTENGLRNEELVKLAHVFDHQSPIESLILNENNFTHSGLLSFAKILRKNTNNLIELAVCDLIFDDDVPSGRIPKKEDEEFDASVFYQALTLLVSNSNSKLQKLSFPIYKFSKDADEIELNNFLKTLSTNTTITTLELSDDVTDETLQAMIDLVSVNHHIVEIKYHYHESVFDEKLHHALIEKLQHNKIIAIEQQNKTVPKSEQTDKKTQSKAIAKTADKNTFVTVLDYAKANYKLDFIDDDKTLVIELENNYQAEVVMRTFNSNELISKVEGKYVIFPNYLNIPESTIATLSIMLEICIRQSAATKVSGSPQLNLEHYLSNLRQIRLMEEDNDLLVGLTDVLKMNGSQVTIILQKIAKLLEARQIHFAPLFSQIKIPNFRSIPEANLVGITNEIKMIINENYTACKTPIVKPAYSSINYKLNEKHKDKQSKKIEKCKNANSAKPATSKQELEQRSPSPLENSISIVESVPHIANDIPRVECKLYGQFLTAMPTKDKFKKLVAKILSQESNGPKNEINDPLMLMMVKHHDASLNISQDDPETSAYCLLYHAIRISELTQHYVQKKYPQFTRLTNSAYGMRTILLDVSHEFSPTENPHVTIEQLQGHPQSFLTVSRQILLDIFDDKTGFKVKLQLGFSNVMFYKQFFSNDANPKKNNLAIPDSLSVDPLAVLTKMRVIVRYMQTCFSETTSIKNLCAANPLTHTKLCAAKGALFLLGHFSRILRDYHEDICNEFLDGIITKKIYSAVFTTALQDCFDKTSRDKSWRLVDHLNKLSETKVQELGDKATLLDCCLLLIEVRNKMAHHFDYQDDSLDLSLIVEEIPVQTVAYLSLFFINNPHLEMQLNHIIDAVQWKNSGLNKVDPEMFSSELKTSPSLF